MTNCQPKQEKVEKRNKRQDKNKIKAIHNGKKKMMWRRKRKMMERERKRRQQRESRRRRDSLISCSLSAASDCCEGLKRVEIEGIKIKERKKHVQHFCNNSSLVNTGI